MDPNFTGSGSFNFSKATGYQEGSSCNLFLVQTGNNWYLGPFLISELGIFNYKSDSFLKWDFFFQDNAIRKKKKRCEVGELLTVAIQRVHLCSGLSGSRAPCPVPSLGEEAVQGMMWAAGLWKHLGLPFLLPAAAWFGPFSCWLMLSPK